MERVEARDCKLIYKNFLGNTRILITETKIKPRETRLSSFDIMDADLWIHNNKVLKSKVSYSLDKIITDDQLNQLFGESL